MRRRLSIFLPTIFLTFGLIFCYVGSRLLSPLELPGAWRLLAWGLLALPFAQILSLPLIYWRSPRSRSRPSPWLTVVYFNMALLSFVLFWVAARDITLAGAVLWQSLTRAPVALGVWEKLYGPAGTLGILALSALLVWRGNRNVKNGPRVLEIEVPIRNLPPGLNGFKVAQLSDLHLGRSLKGKFLKRVVDRVNELGADLVAITGDLADGSVEELREDLVPLSTLQSTAGTFYVTGNHEYYWGAKHWVEEIRRLAGIHPLLNSHHLIERASHRLVVAGVPDLWAHRVPGHDHPAPDPESALAGAPDDAIRILLAHQPKCALMKGAERYHLQLSGHTHGGQFLPWTLVISLFHPVVRGLNRYRNRWIYVNRGTGYWGPPVRLGAPSEITLLKLTPEPA